MLSIYVLYVTAHVVLLTFLRAGPTRLMIREFGHPQNFAETLPLTSQPANTFLVTVPILARNI